MGYFMRENGYYYIKVEHGQDSYRFTTKTKDPELAKDIYNSFLMSLMQKQIGGKLEKKQNLVTYSIETQGKLDKVEIEPVYLEYLDTDKTKGISEGTIKFKNRLCGMMKKAGFIYFSDFTQANINKFIQFLRSEYSSNDTIMKFITKFKAFLHYAIKKQFFPKDDYESLDFINLPGRIRDTIITEADLKAIIQHLNDKKDHDFAMYIKTLYWTCSRPSEITHIKVSDFDFAGLCARIEQPKLSRTSADTAKTAYLTDSFARELKEYIEKNNITDYIFQGHYTTNQYFYSIKFIKLKKQLELNPEYNLYALRHTSYTNILNTTNDIHFASKMAGHKNLDMAEHYANRKSEHFKELAKKMNIE